MQRQETKITKLDSQYAREQAARQKRDHLQKQYKKRRLWRLAGLFGVLVVVLLVLGRQLWQSKKTQASLQTQITNQKQHLNKTQDLQKELKIQVNQLNDPIYVDKLIRYKYDYSKSGELVFILPETEQKISATN